MHVHPTYQTKESTPHILKLIADLHTHTLVSNHAFSTVNELCIEAARQGLRALAVTDHGVAMPDAPHKWYFNTFRRMPHIVNGGFLLLKGVEANVVDRDGNLDMDPQLLKKLDWVIASIHQTLNEPATEEETTRMWLNVAENPLVDMIGHPEQRQFPFDHVRVAKAFGRNNKVVEINCASPKARPGNEEVLRAFAQCCKAEGVKVAVTSDAHSMYNLADKQWGVSFLEEIGYPEELVVNSSMGRLSTELRQRGKPAAESLLLLNGTGRAHI